MSEVKEALETLKELCELVEEAKTPREFLNSLKDFVNFIIDTPVFKQAIKELEKEINLKEKTIKEFENLSVKELKRFAKKILKIADEKIKNTKVKILNLNNKEDEYQKLKRMNLEIKLGRYEEIKHDLKRYISTKNKYLHPLIMFKNFIGMNIRLHWIEKLRFEPLNQFEKYIELKEKIEKEKKYQTWCCWGYLKNFLLVNKLDENELAMLVNKFSNDKPDNSKVISSIFKDDLIELIVQLHTLEKKEKEYINYPDRFIKNSFVADYKSYCKEIYRYLLTFYYKENDNQKLINLKNTKINPYCYEEGNIGYLKFSLYGKKHKIGLKNSRAFRLLKFLLDSGLENRRNIEEAYKAIELPKDKSIFDSILSHGSKRIKIEQLRIIKNTIKELQKGNKLKEGKAKLKIRLDSDKNLIWIELIK